MQEVIVAVDDSKRSFKSLPVGRALAVQLGAPLRVYSAVADEQAARERREAIERFLNELGEAPANLQLDLVPATSPVEGLLALNRERPDAVVCMGTHGRNAVAELALGSVAAAVVQGAGRPVVLAGPHLSAQWQGPVQTVMVCLDGSPLSEAVLPVAAELARRLGVGMTLLHVLHPDDLPSGWSGHQVDEGYELRPVDPESHGSGRSEDLREWGYLQGMAARVKRDYGVEAGWEVLHGRDAGAAVVSYCKREAGSLIVMTTHGRTGLARLALGSVAMQVVREAECPVAVMRPAGG